MHPTRRRRRRSTYVTYTFERNFHTCQPLTPELFLTFLQPIWFLSTHNTSIDLSIRMTIMHLWTLAQLPLLGNSHILQFRDPLDKQLSLELLPPIRPCNLHKVGGKRKWHVTRNKRTLLVELFNVCWNLGAVLEDGLDGLIHVMGMNAVGKTSRI